MSYAKKYEPPHECLILIVIEPHNHTHLVLIINHAQRIGANEYDEKHRLAYFLFNKRT